MSIDSTRMQEMIISSRNIADKFSGVFNSLNDAIIVSDKDGCIFMMNNAGIEMFNVKTPIGKNIDDIFKLENPSSESCNFSSIVFNSLKNDYLFNGIKKIHVILSNNKHAILSYSASVLKTSGTTNEVVIVLRDVTESQKRIDEMSLTLNFLELLSKGFSVDYFKYYIEQKSIYPLFSDALKLCPYKNDVPMSFEEWLVPEDFKILNQAFSDLKSNRIKQYDMVFKSNLNKEIRYYDLHLSISCKNNLQNNDIIIGILSDITFEKIQDSRINDSINVLKNIISSIPFPIYVKDVDDNYRYVSCNIAFCNRIGLDENEVIGKTDYQIIPFPSDVDDLRKNDKSVSLLSTVKEFNESYRKRDGTLSLYKTQKQILKLKNGKKYLLGVSIDYSDDIADLKNHYIDYKLLNAILESLPLGIFLKDIHDDSKYPIFTKSFPKIKELSIDSDERFSNSSIESETNLSFVDEKLLNTRETIQTIHKVYDKKSSKNKTYSVLRKLLKLENKEFILGTANDISEIDELENSNEQYLKQIELLDDIDKLSNKCLSSFSSEMSIEKNVSIILETFANKMGADKASILYDCNEKIEKRFEWEINGLKTKYDYIKSDFISWINVLRNNEIIVVNSVLNMPESLISTQECLLSEGIKSVISAPVFIDNNFVAFMTFSFVSQQHNFTDFDNKLILEAVQLFKISYSKQKQLDKIVNEQKLQDTIFNNIDFPMVIIDSSRTIRAINNNFFAIWDIGQKDIIGKKCYDKNVCLKNGTSYCNMENCTSWKCLSTGKEVNSIRIVNGKKLRVHTTPVLNDKGLPLYSIVTVFDISDIENEKNELVEKINQNDIIRECTSCMILETDMISTIKRIISILAKRFNSHSIGLYRYHDKKPFSIEKIHYELQNNFSLPANIERVLEQKLYKTISYLKESLKPIRYSSFEDSTRLLEIKNELDIFVSALNLGDIILIPIIFKEILWGFLITSKIKSHKNFLKSDEGFYLNVINIINVVLERESREQILESELSVQSYIFDNVKLAMVMLDSGKKIVAINNECCSILGVSRDNVIGKTCENSFCKAFGSEVCSSSICPILKTLATGKNASYEFQNDAKYFKYSTQPILNIDGSFKYVVESIIDQTDDIRKRDLLRNQRNELSAFNRELQQYISQDKIVTSCIDIVAFENDTNVAFQKLLNKIGPHLNSDNCAIYKYNGGTDATFSLITIWTSKDTVHQLDKMDLIPENNFPNTYKRLRNGNSIHFKIRDENFIEEWMREVFRYLSYTKEDEILLSPLMCGGKFWGYMGIEHNDSRKEYTSCALRLFNSISHIAEIILERADLRKDVQAEIDEKQLLFDMLPMPIVLFDTNLFILEANPAAFKLLGKCKGKSSNDVFCSMHCSISKEPDIINSCPVRRTLVTGRPSSELILFSGTKYIVNAVPIIKEGKVVKVLESLIDISKIGDTSKSLQSVLKNDQLNSFPIDIIEPLKKIASEIENLVRNETNIGQKESLKNLSKSFTSLLMHINIKRNYPETNNIQKGISVELDSMLKRLENLFANAAKDKGIQLHFEIDAECKSIIINNSNIDNILASLISKCIKYTESGVVNIQVTYEESILRNSALINFRIKDTGCGMSDDYLKMVISKRAHRLNSYGNLSISEIADLVANQKGSFKIFSHEGKGTCFTLKIMANKIEKNHTSNLNAKFSLGKRVLVVDDIDMNVKLLTSMLKKMKYDALGVSNAKDALDVLDTFKPEWILTDIWMPDLNGADFARMVRAKDDTKKMRIFAITADAECNQSFDMSCFNDIVLKPITTEKLKSIFNKVTNDYK